MSPKTKRKINDKKLIELVDFVKILELEIVGEPQSPEEENQEEILKVNSLISLCFSRKEAIKIRLEKDGQGFYYDLRKGNKSLFVWLDRQDNRAIGIGKKDYYVTREGKLIELIDGGLLDIIPKRRSGSLEYQLVEDREGGFIINLKAIKENKEVLRFFQ